ncbi:MAG: transposase [Streptosporangiaceae bacterium]
MVEALIVGERDPQVLAGLARGRMKGKQARLTQALTGRFDTRHGELARMLLDQIDALTAEVATLTTRIEELIAAIPEAWGVDPDDTTGRGAGHAPGSPVLPAIDRLDEITGIGRDAAQVIIAEVGLRMEVFPTAGHLVSWAKVSPRTVQSGNRSHSAGTGNGNPYLKGIPGSAAAAAARTDTFPGQRYRRLARPARQAQSPRRRRKIHPRHRLAPARRPHRPLPRPRRWLLRHQDQQEPQDPRPRPPARSPRLHRDTRPGRIGARQTPS